MKAWPAYDSDDKSHSDFWEHVVLGELWMNDAVLGLVSEPHFVDDGLQDRVVVEALVILCVLEDVWELRIDRRIMTNLIDKGVMVKKVSD